MHQVTIRFPQFLLYFLSRLSLFLLGFSSVLSAQEHQHHNNKSNPSTTGNIHVKHDVKKVAAMQFYSADHDEKSIGKWESVVPQIGGGAIGKSLGMQTVHAIMLPSGKILLSSGSSWRNAGPMEYYPKFPDPAPGRGCFNMYNDPFHESKLAEYYQLVNNSAIYDPAKNTFYRIPAPYPAPDPEEEDHFIPNDFFCSGHIPLPDGNPLFIGGTQYYYPFRTGTRTSYIFDWRKEMTIDWKKVDWRIDSAMANKIWTSAGLMTRGRWYPTLVPLMDGRFAVFSGFVGFQKGYDPMYQFEINSYIEFFDPSKFDARHPERAWKSIDVKKMPGSPFTQKLKYPQQIDNICYDMPYFAKFGIDDKDPDFKQPCDCPARCIEDNKYDAFKLYPHNYLLDKNKIYLTREGDWVSLRTPKTEFMRRTFSTYWMEFGGSADAPSVKFSPGPDRKDTITSYGTSYLDPNTGMVTILGGQPTSPGTLLPLGAEHPDHFAGGLGSRKIEQFHLNKEKGEGYWTLEPDFMGTEPQDDRTMQYAIILPTRQILIINGGNYDFYGGVLYPILLTPQFDEKGNFVKYKKDRMASAVEPRLYHNSAMLMEDGRIWVSGGNAARATVYTEPIPAMDSAINRQPLPNPDLVELDVCFYTDGRMAKQQKGSEMTPVENWTAEFFSPPYLFIDGDRRASIDKLDSKDIPGVRFAEQVGEKTIYLLRSNQQYEMTLSGLPSMPFTKDQSVVLLKMPSVTHGGQWGQHFIQLPITGKKSANTIVFQTPDAQKELIAPGYYVMYYVDRMGKPSKGQILRFDDQAVAP